MDFLDLTKLNLYNVFALGFTFMEINMVIASVVGLTAIILNVYKVYEIYIQNREKNKVE